ncbi:MAG: hypothetical protein J0L93_03545 [Deltaproteobacteria bacterium]|nr:hypothetical protein [Deltaproteobacteria bacterium]
MIQSTPDNSSGNAPATKSVFLKNLLEKRFPTYHFSYFRFAEFKAPALKKIDAPDGVIAEIKNFTSTSLKTFDAITKAHKNSPIILIVTPSGFQLLNQKRKKVLHSCIVALSETKSLDYLIQLPRLIEEIGRKKRLKAQNERLQRLVEKKFPQLSSFDPARSLSCPIQSRQILGELLGPREDKSKFGLKITLNSWSRAKSALSDIGTTEVIDLISRMIQSAVRNSDRILHNKENEFLIFLSNADSSHLSKCKDRLEDALKGLKIHSNKREWRLPFVISSIETGAHQH